MNPIQNSRTVPLDDARMLDSLSPKIASGKAYLKVLAYPWGVELEVAEEAQQT